MSLENILERKNVNDPDLKKILKKLERGGIDREGYSLFHAESLDKKCVADPSGKILFGGFHDAIDEFEWIDGRLYLRVADLSEKNYYKGYSREDGSFAFGGLHYLKGSIEKILGVSYLIACHKPENYFKYFDEEGVEYDQLFDVYLSHAKEEIVSLGLWKPFYFSVRKIYDSSTETPDKKNEFLGCVISIVKERADKYKDNPILLKNSLTQLVLGLEHFASHPEESMEFVQV